MWQIILHNSSFPKDEYYAEPDEETSSPQLNDKDIEFLSTFSQVKLTSELIGYWMTMAF